MCWSSVQSGNFVICERVLPLVFSAVLPVMLSKRGIFDIITGLSCMFAVMLSGAWCLNVANAA